MVRSLLRLVGTSNPASWKFRVQIQRDDEHLPEAKLTASVLAPTHLAERELSSGIPSTVELSTPFPEALELAAEILRAAKSAGIPLPKGVVLRWNFPDVDA